MSHLKVTIGFVSQKFETVNGKHVCVGQDFIASDQVDYENDAGETVDIDVAKEQYQPFDMVQPD